MDAFKVRIERIDPGARIAENSFNSAAPDTDLKESSGISQGIVRTTPAHMLKVRVLLAKLNLGYATGLSTAETAITNITA